MQRALLVRLFQHDIEKSFPRNAIKHATYMKNVELYEDYEMKGYVVFWREQPFSLEIVTQHFQFTYVYEMFINTVWCTVPDR